MEEQRRLIRCYRPNMRHDHGLFMTWALMARNAYGARGLIWELFKRDFIGGYKKSFLGLSWLVIAPVMGIAARFSGAVGAFHCYAWINGLSC